MVLLAAALSPLTYTAAVLPSFTFDAATDTAADHERFGRALGVHFADRIRARLAAKPSLTQLVETARAEPALYDSFLELHATAFPRYVAELRGLAAGSGLDFQALFVQNVAQEFSLCAGLGGRVEEHCSDFALCAASAADGACALAHNEDNQAEDRNATVLVTARFGDAVPAFEAYTYLGELPSGAFGFNDAGVAFTLNYVAPTQPQCPGLGRGFFSRALLEAPTLEAAVRAVTDSRGAGGHNYQLAWFGASGPPRVVNLEVAPRGEHALTPIGASPAFHANQYAHLAVPQELGNSTIHRTARAAKLLPAIGAATPAAAPSAMLHALGDQYDRQYPIFHDERSHQRGDLSDWTVATALFDLRQRSLAIFAGNPRDGKLLASRALPHAPSASPSISCEATSDALTVTLTANASTLARADLHYVTLARPDRPDRPLALSTVALFPASIGGLRPNTTYTVGVFSHPTHGPSMAWGPGWREAAPAINCSTAASVAPAHASVEGAVEGPAATASRAAASATAGGSRFSRVYRISEYSFSVDFLENHDAADAESMPLYLMTCDPMGNCAPWALSDLTRRWDGCQAALDDACGAQRGGAFGCMSCADAHRASITAACGEWSDADTLDGEGSFGVHWFCGVGWPESVAEEGPITEYCVEMLPVPPEQAHIAGAADGWSGYLSCNSDETDALGNDARDPSCICIVYDDRLLAHEPLSKLRQDCFVGELPWVNETICNCTGAASEVPAADNPSVRYAGRAPVYMPYVGVKMEPQEEYVDIPSGYNYHFPRAGACGEGEALGSRGCTWQRKPLARMLYGEDLVAAGWDRAFVPDTPTNVSHSRANIAAFAKAVRALDSLVAPAPCGTAPSREAWP